MQNIFLEGKMQNAFLAGLAIAIICSIPLIAIVFLILFHFNKNKVAALKGLSTSLPGKVMSAFVPAYKGEYNGVKFLLSLMPANDNEPPCLKVAVFKNFPFYLSISRESPITQLFKKIHLMREIKINDSVFDEKFFISSNSPREAERYLTQEKRIAIEGFFKKGFNSFIIYKNNMSIVKPDYDLINDLRPENIKMLVQELVGLAFGL